MLLAEHLVQMHMLRDGSCAQMKLRIEQVTIHCKDDLYSCVPGWHSQDSPIKFFDMLVCIKLNSKADGKELWSGILDSHVLKQKGRYFLT